MYLFINAATPQQAYLCLVTSKETSFTKHIALVVAQKKNLLVEIDKFLKAHKILPQSIKGVVVVTGPGQFSFLRTGIIIANTFGFSLTIPVVGLSLSEFSTPEEFIAIGLEKLKKTKKFVQVMPEYGAEPNITQPKK